LPYPEQKADYAVPERYILTPSEKGRTDVPPSLGVTPTDTLSSDTEITTTELDQSGRPREQEVKVPKDVVLVTWESEDDPENPLNWSVTHLPLFDVRCRSDE